LQGKGSSKRRRDPEEEIPDIKRDIGFGRPLFLDGKYCDFNQIKCVCVCIHNVLYIYAKTLTMQNVSVHADMESISG
jgi:hypothetical protein